MSRQHVFCGYKFGTFNNRKQFTVLFLFANENSVPLYSYAISMKFRQRSENSSLKK